ncbi:MAG: hypothetical protein OXC03_06305 [Flavobacteriaceae bacterium]|nr:hypothetical protein [Flavobacteriaceae bacterium]
MPKLFIAFAFIFLSSCMAVKFPSEIKVSLDLPENMTEENMSKLIDKIPDKLSKKNVKVYVAVPKGVKPQVKEDVSIGPRIQ